MHGRRQTQRYKVQPRTYSPEIARSSPSDEDIKLTRKLVEGAKLLDLVLQDHVIVGDMGYYSFADNGML